MKNQAQTAERDYVAPTQQVPEDTFALRIKGHANAHVLKDGDVALFAPGVPVEPGDTVVVQIAETGEIVIGKFQPLHSTSPEAPGFIIIPHNREFDQIRCTRKSPGEILGRLVEKHEFFP